MNQGLQILLSKYEHLNFDVYRHNGCTERLQGSMTPNEALEKENMRSFADQEVYFTARNQTLARTED